MIKFIKDLVTFIKYKRLEAKYDIGFFCESYFIYHYIEPYIKKKLKKKKLVLIAFENIKDDQIDNKNIFVFKSNFFRELIFLTLNIKYLYSSTPDLNKTIFKKSKLHKCNYIYLQHTPVSLTMIYSENAFTSFDAIQVINKFQFAEMVEMKRKFNLKIKIFKSKYLFTEKAAKLSVDLKTDVLVAPTWNSNFYKLNCHIYLKKYLDKKKISFKIRPHPMSYRKGEITIKDLKNLKIDIDQDEFINFNKYNFFISDWSGLFIEYAMIFKRKSYLINTPKKISNKNYKNYSSLPIEISLRDILCQTYKINNLIHLAADLYELKMKLENSNFLDKDFEIQKIIEDNFY